VFYRVSEPATHVRRRDCAFFETVKLERAIFPGLLEVSASISNSRKTGPLALNGFGQRHAFQITLFPYRPAASMSP
jgi:hypothetical protein